MPQSELPADVQQLLKEHIRSIEQLEILLLLHNRADRLWTPAEVYHIIQSSERSVTDTLETLSRQGLLRKVDAPHPTYQFHPQAEGAPETIGRLAQFYVERRVRIVEAIYSDRTSAADEFAKAFRLRKEDHG